ncbi:MAG TPA: hypothetical protein VFO07_19825, partial [Roseiflexaceae bacterium]|nr:hypothetical protein [Roseiflexaceae bacterium]
MKRAWSALALLFLALILVGCGSTIGREQIAPTAPKSVTLENGHTIGQTFVARSDGLAGIELYIIPKLTGDGEISLHLRSSPQDSVDLATTSLPLAQDARPGFYRFSFAPQSDSRGHDYYA